MVDEKIMVSETDIAIDMIATPTRLVHVERQTRRPRGIRWDLISKDRISEIPPLQELARMRGIA